MINKIEKGYAIVTGIEEGIYAKACPSDKLIVENMTNGKSFESEMDYKKLKSIAEEGGYWSYVAGVAACIKEQYNISGVKLIIDKVTIPEKKGLSSSAAICVLVSRAFNELYKLHLNTLGEMNLAYYGEITTPSRCGKLDQACAFGKRPILMCFDGDKVDIKNIKVSKPLYFVFADLNSHKDTIKILGDLNRSYPFIDTDFDKSVHEALGRDNKEIVLKAVEYLENGEIEKFGMMMSKAQENFDKKVAPASIKELSAPILHKVINDNYIKKLSFGIKGVGSQGDGTVQVLARDSESQRKIQEYFKDKLNMSAYTLTIEATKPVKKAIIPVAGNGIRMYPITKCIKKSFLPVIDNGLVKPTILCLMEEIVKAGIEEICLIIDEDEQKEYDKLFNNKLSREVASKLSPELLEYESFIEKIGKKITYVYQREKLGLGHAVSLCKSFANGDPVLLVLGDQIYKSNINKSCTEQFLDSFAKTNKLSISVGEVDLKDVSKYGILCGEVHDDNDYFMVSKMVEKPSPIDAEEKYYTKVKNNKKYYAVFGEYILTEEVFETLDDNILNHRLENGEYQITSAIDKVREQKGMVAFIPNGVTMDVGNVKAYQDTFILKAKDNN